MTTPTGPDVADALAAEGTEITLVDWDGQPLTVSIRYSLDSLRYLERKYGDIRQLQTVFADILGSLDGNVRSEHLPFESLTVFLAAGLRHVRYYVEETGQTIRLGSDLDRVAEMLELNRLRDYIGAFAKAFGQSMGPTTPRVQAPVIPAPEDAQTLGTSTGPGASGGTSPSTLGTFGQTSSGD